jgi:hypothetical protein
MLANFEITVYFKKTSVLLHSATYKTFVWRACQKCAQIALVMENFEN